LWILSEAKEESGDRIEEIEKRLDVGDVAKELKRILQKEEEESEKMDEVQQNGHDEEVIEIE
jgi:hypothetical protein